MPNIAVPAPPESLFKLKFHQVSIFHYAPEIAVNFWSAAGFTNWTHDECKLTGTEWGLPMEMREQEYFNYDILPLELCYMQYSTGIYNSRGYRKGDPPFIALMAAYVDDLEAQMERIQKTMGLYPYRLYDSSEHKNPYLTEQGITFHKCLYDTTSWLGFDVKLTQKVFSK